MGSQWSCLGEWLDLFVWGDFKWRIERLDDFCAGLRSFTTEFDQMNAGRVLCLSSHFLGMLLVVDQLLVCDLEEAGLKFIGNLEQWHVLSLQTLLLSLLYHLVAFVLPCLISSYFLNLRDKVIFTLSCRLTCGILLEIIPTTLLL